MCFTVLPNPPVQQLIIAAQHVQHLLNDGTLAAAFGASEPEQTASAVSAFDRLNEAAAKLASEQKHVSPFLRYRREIMAHYETAERLRGLVLNLWGGRPANLSMLFHGADEHHTRIALELIVSFTHYGENDSQFMCLASEIMELEMPVREVAA